MQCFEDSGLGSSLKSGAASQPVDGLPAIKQGNKFSLSGLYSLGRLFDCGEVSMNNDNDDDDDDDDDD